MATGKQVDSLVVFEQQVVAAKPRFEAMVKAQRKLQLPFDSELNFAVIAAKDNPALLNCTAASVSDAISNLAAMGLSLNKVKGEAALVPRWNRTAMAMVCTAMPMYRGRIKLAVQTGQIKNVWSDLVLDGDFFEVEKGTSPKVTHRPKLRTKSAGVPSPDNVIAAYVVAEIVGSAYLSATVVPIDEILSVAERSESYNPKPKPARDGKPAYTPKPSGPWVTDFGQMCIKTAFNRAYKTWPMGDMPSMYGLHAAAAAELEADIADQAAPEPQAAETGTLSASADDLQKINAALAEIPEPGRTKVRGLVCKAYGVETMDALKSGLGDEVSVRIRKFVVAAGKVAA